MEEGKQSEAGLSCTGRGERELFISKVPPEWRGSSQGGREGQDAGRAALAGVRAL